jgi:hypothetical protein
MALLFAGAALMVHPASADSFNNVQVFAATSSSRAYSFQFAAYNLTGSLIASTQTSYPAAAFELPTGGYLFTVSATTFSDHIGYACPLAAGGVSKGAGAVPPMERTNSPSTAPILPIQCFPPSSEYGYATASISESQTINIVTKNISEFPTTAVTVKASYINGTAASDASVYASIIGEWYFWWGPNSSIKMGAQTDSSGIAHLVLPIAPAVITAWKWIPIFAGSNGSTIQTTVGGQEVNTTVYWEPTYIGLSGSGLLLPPQDNIDITLRYQQPDYWVLPANVASRAAYSGSALAGTVASQPSGVPSVASGGTGTQSSTNYYLPSQIPSFQQNTAKGTSVGSRSGFGTNTLAAATIAFVAAILAVILVAARHRSHRPPSQVG